MKKKDETNITNNCKKGEPKRTEEREQQSLSFETFNISDLEFCSERILFDENNQKFLFETIVPRVFIDFFSYPLENFCWKKLKQLWVTPRNLEEEKEKTFFWNTRALRSNKSSFLETPSLMKWYNQCHGLFKLFHEIFTKKALWKFWILSWWRGILTKAFTSKIIKSIT